MSTKRSVLLTLPCELRLQIYAYTLTLTTTLEIKPPITATKTNKWWDRPYRDYTAPGLLLTSRLVRSEALKLYHKFLLAHLADLQGTIGAIDMPRKCVFIVGNSPSLGPKEDTLLRCERDATEKEVSLVELEWQGAVA